MTAATRRTLLGSLFVAWSGAALAQPPYPPIPPPRSEPMPPPPHGAYVWRPGYWAWNGRHYVWCRAWTSRGILPTMNGCRAAG